MPTVSLVYWNWNAVTVDFCPQTSFACVFTEGQSKPHGELVNFILSYVNTTDICCWLFRSQFHPCKFARMKNRICRAVLCRGCYQGMRPQVQTGPGKKSKRIVTNSVHNAHNSMTKGMLDEDKVMETCDHANIECFQTCWDWEWFTSKTWRERGNYLDESCLKCKLPMLGDAATK